MNNLNFLLFMFFLFYLFFVLFHLHNLFILLNRILLLCISPRLMWRLNGTLLLLINESLKLFILHSFTLRFFLLLKNQFPFLSLFNNFKILLLKIDSRCEDLRILLIKFIAIHQHLVDISMKLARMLIVFLPEIILHGLEIHGFQYNVEILRYT